MTLSERFSANVRTFATERKRSLCDIARGAKMSESHFTSVLRGQVSLSVRVVERVAESMGVDPVALLEEW